MDSSDDDALTKPKAIKKPDDVSSQTEKPKKTYARKAKEVVNNTLKGTVKGKVAKTHKEVLSELECDLEREEALLQRLEEKASKRKALQAEIRKPNIPEPIVSESDSEVSEPEPEPEPKKQKSTKKGIAKPIIPEPKDKTNKLKHKITSHDKKQDKKQDKKADTDSEASESESEASVIEEIIVKKKKKTKPSTVTKKKKVIKRVIEVTDSDTDTGSDSDGTPPQPTTRATKSQQNKVTKVIPQLPQSRYYFA